jgi:hypothetical protein
MWGLPSGNVFRSGENKAPFCWVQTVIVYYNPIFLHFLQPHPVSWGLLVNFTLPGISGISSSAWEIVRGWRDFLVAMQYRWAGDSVIGLIMSLLQNQNWESGPGRGIDLLTIEDKQWEHVPKKKTFSEEYNPEMSS